MRLSAHRCTLGVLLCLLAAPASAGHYEWFRPNAFDLEAGWVSAMMDWSLRLGMHVAP